MEPNKFLVPLIWPFLKLFFLLILFALLLGLIVGIFTYGKPIKKRRNQSLMDDVTDMGMNLSHILISSIIKKFKNRNSRGTWLNDQEILAMMRGMHPSEFEEFTAKLFASMGYQVQIVGGANDGGIDIEMTKDGRKSIVQCKKFITRKVTPHDVRDFFGAMGDRHIDGKGFFVTTNIFTLEAERFAEGKPMELIDGVRLIQLVRKSDILGKQQSSQTDTQFTPQQEKCPQCGSTLVTRVNRTNGRRFLGCSRYPACRFTENTSHDVDTH